MPSYKISIIIVSTSSIVESITSKCVDEYKELNAAPDTEQLCNDNYPTLLFSLEVEVTTCTTILHMTLAERFTTVKVERPKQPLALC